MTTPRITLRQLQVFLAVASTGTTTAAAQELALSQSAISAALLELEQLLGLRLFDRMGRRLLLNADGRALMPRALALLDGAEDLEGWAHGGPTRIGRLRLGASTTIGNYLLPDILAQFAAGLSPGAGDAGQGNDQGNDWSAQVSIANTAAIAAQVSDLQLDLGLIEGPCHEPGLTVLPWLQDELVIAAARHDPLCTQRRWDGIIPLAALREADWLLRETGSGTRETVEQSLIPHLHQLRTRIELGSSEAIKRAVLCGLGITCLSRFALRDLLAVGDLVELRTELPPIRRQLFIIHRSRRTPARGVQLLLERLRAMTPQSITDLAITDLATAGPAEPAAFSPRARIPDR